MSEIFFYLEPTKQVPRAATTISTTYQFGVCKIQQLGSTFIYDCEYYGPSDHLIVTPLTERVQLSMTAALNNYQCASIVGSPSTGKTYTVKDLAKVCNGHKG